MNLVAIGDFDVRHSPRRLRQDALGARQHPLELAGSRNVVGVHVRVEQQRRLEAHLRHNSRVSLCRDVHRVDDDCLCDAKFEDTIRFVASARFRTTTTTTFHDVSEACTAGEGLLLLVGGLYILSRITIPPVRESMYMLQHGAEAILYSTIQEK